MPMSYLNYRYDILKDIFFQFQLEFEKKLIIYTTKRIG